jgi:hypothetical protein
MIKTLDITATMPSTDTEITVLSTGFHTGIVRAVIFTNSTSSPLDSTCRIQVRVQSNSRPIIDSLDVSQIADQTYPLAVGVNSTNGAIAAYTEVVMKDERIRFKIDGSSAGDNATIRLFLEGDS